MSRFAFPGVLLVGLALTPLSAQDEPRMVELNVVALDSHGAPVTGLTRDDFRVVDSGKPQAIEFFRHRDSGGEPPAQLEPNEFSNRGGSNVPRATVILFDLMNEKFGTRGAAANRLVQDLRSLESADYVYLYLLTLSGRLYPVRGLPGTEGEIRSENGQPWTRQVKRMLDQGLRTVLQVRPVEEDVAYRTQLTYVALSAMAAELSRVPGRKSIVWLTDGVPIELGPNRSDTGEFVDFTPLLRQMSESMDRAGVSIYPVRQVMIGSQADINATPGGTGMGDIATLDEFAHLTGGRPDGGKDIGAAVRQSMVDTRTSYQIGYYPPEQHWDDKFHKLQVTCSKKGVRLQTKTGYYAWREAPGSHSTQAIRSAMATRFDAAEIGLRGKVTMEPGGDGKARLEARIDAHDLVLVPRGNQYDGQLRVAIVGYVPGKPPSSGPIAPVDLHYDAAERDRALREGISFTQDLSLAGDIESVRLIVFDRNSNAIGSLTIPVAPPAAAKAQ